MRNPVVCLEGRNSLKTLCVVDGSRGKQMQCNQTLYCLLRIRMKPLPMLFNHRSGFTLVVAVASPLLIINIRVSAVLLAQTICRLNKHSRLGA